LEVWLWEVWSLMANTRKDREREEYLEWLMTPKGLRDPQTKVEVAERLHVERRTLYSWEADPSFQAAVRARKSALGTAWYGDLLNTLKDIADDSEQRSSDRISAVRVLLSHLDPKEEDKAAEVVNVDSLKKNLEAQGWKIVK
jgi:hypothetical protein